MSILQNLDKLPAVGAVLIVCPLPIVGALHMEVFTYDYG